MWIGVRGVLTSITLCREEIEELYSPLIGRVSPGWVNYLLYRYLVERKKEM